MTTTTTATNPPQTLTERLASIYGTRHSVVTGEASAQWLTQELNLIHAQRQTTERRLAEAEAEAASLRSELARLRARKTPPRDKGKVEPGVTWEVRTALKGSGDPDWLVRSGHGTQEGAEKEVASCGHYWRSQGLRVSVRRVEG